MKIATFNANSVRVRLEQILAWLSHEAPDILCIQETKAQDHDFPSASFQAAGYHVVFRGRKSYAGVAIASREKPSDVVYGFDDGGDPDGARLIRASVAGVTVINTYVPQGRALDSEQFAYKLDWLKRFHRLIEDKYNPSQRLVWCGDFNVAPESIDVYDPAGLKNHVACHPLARESLEKIREWGFVDVYRRLHPGEAGHYTFWDYRFRKTLERNMGWRVDHIWATKLLADRTERAWIDVEARKAVRPSDHTLLVAEFNI